MGNKGGFSDSRVNSPAVPNRGAPTVAQGDLLNHGSWCEEDGEHHLSDARLRELQI